MTSIRSLKDLDTAALQLATIGAMVLDPTLTDAELRSSVLAIFTPDEIAAALSQVADLAQPPDDTYYDELQARYRRVGRIRPALLGTIQFDALPAGRPILNGDYRITIDDLQACLDRQHIRRDIGPGDVPLITQADVSEILAGHQRFTLE